jgi:hypothetical protein
MGRMGPIGRMDRGSARPEARGSALSSNSVRQAVRSVAALVFKPVRGAPARRSSRGCRRRFRCPRAGRLPGASQQERAQLLRALEKTDALRAAKFVGASADEISAAQAGGGQFPIHWAASQKKGTPRSRQRAMASRHGCRTPVSLLAAMTATREGRWSFSERSSHARSRTPFGVTGISR